MQVIRLIPLLVFAALAAAQSPAPALTVWQMQESGTTAGLRGIDSVDGTVAWASGTNGTVLRTIDGGAHWTQCAVPDAAKDGATLDFRGVQAWDAKTAFVMSSGKGKLSRLYKTMDGCQSWKLNFSNPDKDGFWDALNFRWFGDRKYGTGWLLGDPVHGKFSLFRSDDSGRNWFRQENAGLRADPSKQGAFAASNSSLLVNHGSPVFGSGGSNGAKLHSVTETTSCVDGCSSAVLNLYEKEGKWLVESVPIGRDLESSGIFSIAARSRYGHYPVLVAVGGDCSHPNDESNTAAFKLAFDQPWTASTTPPHGFRSAVQWSDTLKAWITVGTNGSDISRDDGKTWQPLDDGNWNALSLPFVVGPNGRIARINPAALPAAVTKGTQPGAKSNPGTVK